MQVLRDPLKSARVLSSTLVVILTALEETSSKVKRIEFLKIQYFAFL